MRIGCWSSDVCSSDLQFAEALAFMLILQMPVRQIGWMINSIARASTCGGRLFNVLDLLPSIADVPGAPDLVVSEGVLLFEGVSFPYPGKAGGPPTLEGIDHEARHENGRAHVFTPVTNAPH